MRCIALGNRSNSLIAMALTGFLLLPVAAYGREAVPQSVRLNAVSVPFVANDGQLDSRVAFYARTFAGSIFVTADGRLVYSLAEPRRSRSETSASQTPAPGGWAFAETFSGTTGKPVGGRPAAAKISNFVGASTPRHSELNTFDSVTMDEVAAGVSLELRVIGNNVEKLFHVRPGAEVERIKVRLDGANRVLLADDGGLIVGTGLGEVQFTAPLAFQERAGRRVMVSARYLLREEGHYGFAVGEYDHSLPLTIDPLIRSTYSGGGSADVIYAMLVHPGSGDVYVTGSTLSANFPSTTGAQTGNGGGTDAFVARYSPGLTSLVRATYYGGGGGEIAKAIAILPSSGDVYIAGITSSAAGLLNISGSLSGPTDAFIARFDGALSSVISARYYGGSGDEAASGLAVDNISGDIIMAGETTSGDLPMVAGAQQNNTGGGQDAFVVRFSSALGPPFRTTYFGGNGTDRALAVALDPVTGDVVLGGKTDSANLPGTLNGALPTIGGQTDGFVARFDGNLTTLRQSSFFGGANTDQINALAIHPLNGQIYVAGDTTSASLRGKPAGQLTLGGLSDAFIARFHPDLSGLLAVTYFGSIGDDFGNALAISKYTGEVYLAGYSKSSALPGTAGAVQEGNGGASATTDAFVARFDAGLSGVKQTTFLGGTGSEIAYAIALTDKEVFVAGETSTSSNFPGASGSAQSTYGGSIDGFISKLDSDLRLGNSNPAAFSFAAIINALPSSVQISAPAKVMPTGDAIVYVDGQPGSMWCASTGPLCNCNRMIGNSFVSGPILLPTTAPNPYYVCVRQTASAAPNAITESTLHIGAIAATFRVGTGAIPGFGCTLDVDGNGSQDALTDGLLILRALFGLTGTAVTTGATAMNATRTGWSDISAYLNTNCGANLAP